MGRRVQTTRAAMSLPPLTHLSIAAHLAARSLEDAAPTDATDATDATKDALSIDAIINQFILDFGGATIDATGVKRKRPKTKLKNQTTLSVDAVINRFKREFGRALETVMAVAEAAEQPNEAQRVAAVKLVIIKEVAALRDERSKLYSGDPEKGPAYNNLIRKFSSQGTLGHTKIQENLEYIINAAILHRSGQQKLSRERRAYLRQRYEIYTDFTSSWRFLRLRYIEQRIKNAPHPEALAEHAKAAIRILSGQPHRMEEGKPHTYYRTWESAFGLFDAGQADVAIADSEFPVAVRNNTQECGGRVVGSMWLQDLRFQRVLLQLAEEATTKAAQHSHEGQHLAMKWKLNCYEWANPSEGGAFTRPYDQDEGVRIQSFLLSVETAARRVRRWIGTQRMKHKPSKKGVTAGLLGWDLKLKLDALDNRWARKRVEAIASMGGEEDPKTMGAIFARSTARRLLMGKCTRRLARIGTATDFAEGIDGVFDSDNVQIEFGVDSIPNVDAFLAFIARPPDGSSCAQVDYDPMCALYPEHIRLHTKDDSITLENKQRLTTFRESWSKQVALVSWGGRTCVLFKHGSGTTANFKLVDPLGKRGKFPNVLTQTSWVERAAEAASVESGLLTAVVRAMAIAHAASPQSSTTSEEGMLRAASPQRSTTSEERMLLAAWKSPGDGVAPLCAAVAVLAHAYYAKDKYKRDEVYLIADYTMIQVRQAMTTRALLEDRRLKSEDLDEAAAPEVEAPPAAPPAVEMEDDGEDEAAAPAPAAPAPEVPPEVEMEGDEDDAWWDDAVAEDAEVEDDSEDEDDDGWWEKAEAKDSTVASMAFQLVFDPRLARVE